MRNVNFLQRVAVFVDYANINRSANEQNIALDYSDLLDYLVGGRHLVEAIAYVPIDPSLPNARDAECETLWRSSYFVKTKMGKRTGDTYKCNVDVEMTIDMLNAALDMKIDTVILVSGDGDFQPVIAYLRGRGIRAEVCGFRRNTARELALKSSGYIDMEVYLQEQSERQLGAWTDNTSQDQTSAQPETEAPEDALQRRGMPAASDYSREV